LKKELQFKDFGISEYRCLANGTTQKQRSTYICSRKKRIIGSYRYLKNYIRKLGSNNCIYNKNC